MNPFRKLPGLIAKVHTFLYRVSGGRLGGRISGSRVVLLTTTGRKSGKRRTTPLLSLPDGENIVIVASNGGNDRHPVWWLNLQANPEAELRTGNETKPVRAEAASEEEKARLWPLLVEMYSGYARYQQGTERKIPVVVLRPGGQD